MAQNVLILGIAAVEAVIFWLFLRNSTKENQTIKVFIMGIMIGAFSVIQSITRFLMGEYTLLDLAAFFFIFSGMATAYFIAVLTFTPKKALASEKQTTKTVSTSDPVILTSGDTVNVTRDNRTVLKITVGKDGIYFYHTQLGEASPHYFNHNDVFGHWKSGNTNLLTGVPCLTIRNIDQGISITIQADPEYQITF